MPKTPTLDVGGTPVLRDAWHLRQAEALRALCDRTGRPVSIVELAKELGVAEDEITHRALVRQRHAYYRRQNGQARALLWPRTESRPRVGPALRAFLGNPDGTVLMWREARRTGRGGRHGKTRQLTMNKSLRSHVRSQVLAARERLGLSGWRGWREHHLPLLLVAVYDLEMDCSLLPRDLWQSSSSAARAARRNAQKRRSEVGAFLSWAESEGYLSLSILGTTTLPPRWIEWCSLLSDDYRMSVTARRLAELAVELGCEGPERVVAIGFRRVEEHFRALPSSRRVRNGRSLGNMLSRMRRAWDAAAERDGTLPLWPRPPKRGSALHEDGGLQNSWWSAKAFFRGRASALDRPEMAFQKTQAHDLKDWWMLPDPTRRTRMGTDGEAVPDPLPRRPERSRSGRTRFGARSEQEVTALKPLSLVARFQRWALSEDPVAPIPVAEMRRTPWADLFRDRERVLRFVEYELERWQEEHGCLTVTVVDRLGYIATLCWAYCAAWERERREDARREYLALDLTSVEAFARARELSHEIERCAQRVEAWEQLASDVQQRIDSLVLQAGGIQKRKDHTEIRRKLNHAQVRRIADWYREQRHEREAELRAATERLQKARRGARSRPCEVETDEGMRCGARECDLHHPLPSLSAHGIARELFDRTYCGLANKELILRLPSILPWRPGEFRRARCGVHLDPATLRIRLVGVQTKREYDHSGEIRCQESSIGELEYWDDETEVERTIEVLRLVLDDTRLWLHANPTDHEVERRSEDATYLFINQYGTPWRDSSTFGAAFRAALEEGARGVNARLREGEEPITLPSGYGGRGSYILRFLWGHRARAHGASFEDIAAVLGNSVSVAKAHYQDEQPVEAQNRVARRIRHAERSRAADSVVTTLLPAGVLTAGGQDIITALWEAKRVFDEEVGALDLADSVSAMLWQGRQREVLAKLGAG